MTMARIRTLSRAVDTGLTDSLRAAALRLGHSNVFNPSVAVHGSTTVVSYRAYSPARTLPFDAFLAVSDGAAPGEWRITSLTEHAAGFGVAPVADPKLFARSGAIWATFNTGTPARGDNAIYVMPVWPEPGPPQLCELTDGRSRVEKNWAFLAEGTAPVDAIYQLGPLVGLRLSGGQLGAPGGAAFEKVERSATDAARTAAGLTIGSQPLVEDDEITLVAHERYRIGRRRAYAGRLARITGLNSAAPRLRVSSVRLVHSVRAALPQRDTHNPNLISATYFSGIARAESGALLLGYGINDRDFAIARVEEDALWS